MLMRGSIAALTAALLVYLPGAAEAAGPYAGGYRPGYFSGNSPGASYYQGNSYPHYGAGFPGGYYPGYFANYNNPYSPGVYPGYVAPVPVYPQTTPYVPALPSWVDGGAAATRTDGPVALTVHVPADAEVWFDGDATKQQGEWREFTSPPLTPGKEYSYSVRARWMVGGQTVDQTRTLVVHAHDKLEVDFTRP